MTGSIALDLTDEWQMLGYVLHSRIAQLSIEIQTGMTHSRGSVLRSCQYEGLTTKGTKGGALVDLLTLAEMIDPGREVPEVHQRALLTWKKGDEKKVAAVLRKITRDGAKWRTEGRPGSQANPA